MRNQVRAESQLDDASLQVRGVYEVVRRVLEEVGKDGILVNGIQYVSTASVLTKRYHKCQMKNS